MRSSIHEVYIGWLLSWQLLDTPGYAGLAKLCVLRGQQATASQSFALPELDSRLRGNDLRAVKHVAALDSHLRGWGLRRDGFGRDVCDNLRVRSHRAHRQECLCYAWDSHSNEKGCQVLFQVFAIRTGKQGKAPHFQFTNFIASAAFHYRLGIGG